MERLTPEQAASALKAERRQFSQMELREVAARELVLRQWCVDKAIAGCTVEGSAPAIIYKSGREATISKVEFAVVSLAREIYDFVTTQTVSPNLEEKERP